MIITSLINFSSSGREESREGIKDQRCRTDDDLIARNIVLFSVLSAVMLLHWGCSTLYDGELPVDSEKYFVVCYESVNTHVGNRLLNEPEGSEREIEHTLSRRIGHNPRKFECKLLGRVTPVRAVGPLHDSNVVNDLQRWRRPWSAEFCVKMSKFYQNYNVPVAVNFSHGYSIDWSIVALQFAVRRFMMAVKKSRRR